MYIRVKSHKATYFMECDPTDTALDIKQKPQSLVDQPTDNQRLTLLTSNTILEDSKTLAEQWVANNAVVALTLRKTADDNDQFEEVYIARLEEFT